MRGFRADRIANGYQATRGRPIRGYIPGFRIKTPFDFILEHSEHGLAFLDLKTVSTKKFQSLLVSPHQLEILERYSKWHVSGLLIWFRRHDRVVFMAPKQIRAKTQIEMTEGLDIGDLTNMDLSKLMINGQSHAYSQTSDTANEDILPNR